MSDTIRRVAADSIIDYPEIDWEQAERKAQNVILDDDDAPLLTKERLENSQAMRTTLLEKFEPAVASAFLKRAGRPKLDTCKERVTLRLDQDVLQFFRAQGKGWQTKMNGALKDYMENHR